MLTAIILAGGLGTRLRSEVSDVPKPMAPIENRPFLELLMDYWIDQGVCRFILSVGYLWNEIEAHFGSAYRNASIEYSVEDTPLGTGGALLKVLSNYDIDAPFFLLNGDTFFEVNAQDLLTMNKQNGSSGLLFSLMKTNDTKRYLGLDLDKHTGTIRNLNSKASCTDIYANGGVYLINSDAFTHYHQKENASVSLEQDIFPELLKNGVSFRGKCFESARFIDIGIPEDYRRAATVIL